MYSTSDNQLLDGLTCLKMYLQKLNPKCEALFQCPKRNAKQDEHVWYENRPLGVHKLAGMMKEISQLACLWKVYTNHSVRATTIMLLSNAQVPSRHIMAISGHRSEASLQHYNTRPSSEQLRSCSDILSSAMGGRPQQSQQLTLPGPSNPLSLNPMVVNDLGNITQQFVKYQPQALSSLFSNCQVNNVQVFMVLCFSQAPPPCPCPSQIKGSTSPLPRHLNILENLPKSCGQKAVQIPHYKPILSDKMSPPPGKINNSTDNCFIVIVLISLCHDYKPMCFY